MTPDLASLRARVGAVERNVMGRPDYGVDLKRAVGVAAIELGVRVVSDAIGVNRSSVKAWSLGKALGTLGGAQPSSAFTAPRGSKPLPTPALPAARCPRCRGSIELGRDEVQSPRLRTALVLRHIANGCAA